MLLKSVNLQHNSPIIVICSFTLSGDMYLFSLMQCSTQWSSRAIIANSCLRLPCWSLLCPRIAKPCRKRYLIQESWASKAFFWPSCSRRVCSLNDSGEAGYPSASLFFLASRWIWLASWLLNFSIAFLQLVLKPLLMKAGLLFLLNVSSSCLEMYLKTFLLVTHTVNQGYCLNHLATMFCPLNVRLAKISLWVERV